MPAGTGVDAGMSREGPVSRQERLRAFRPARAMAAGTATAAIMRDTDAARRAAL